MEEAFLRVCSHAHGYPTGRAQSVGLAEQVAAISLLKGLAEDFKFLRTPAREALTCMESSYRLSEQPHALVVADAAGKALTGL